ncbi:MAG: hypothetical protein QXP36_09845 [Conexivisphaerales archaeon]
MRGRRRNIPFEARILHGNYYLYYFTLEYDRETYGQIKVSEYIGRITEKRVIEAITLPDQYMDTAIHSLSMPFQRVY